MNDHHQAWQRLTRAARLHQDPRDERAPFGFATRVVAQANAARALSRPQVLLEKFALRGLFAAAALSVAAMGFGYSVLTEERAYPEQFGDTVGEILAAS